MKMLDRLQATLAEYGVRKTFFKIVLYSLNSLYIIRHIEYLVRRNNPDHAIRRINNSKMYLDLKNDRGISWELFIFGKHEAISTEYLSSSGILRRADTVLDIGANIGYYALMESRIVGERGLVYALEPVEQNVRMLKESIELNNIRNIEVCRLAVGDNCRLSTISVGEKGNWSSIDRISGIVYKSQEEVQMVTVDDFVKDRKTPNLVRMDVEGYEYFVFKGMSNTLRCKPRLMVEIHSSVMNDLQMCEMLDILKENDYKNVHVIFDPQLIRLAPKSILRPLFESCARKTGDYIECSSPAQLMSLDSLLDLITRKRTNVGVVFEAI